MIFNRRQWTSSEFVEQNVTLADHTVSSHHVLTLLLGDKLYLAPLSSDIQVWRPICFGIEHNS
jgi:hypothetical protein